MTGATAADYNRSLETCTQFRHAARTAGKGHGNMGRLWQLTHAAVLALSLACAALTDAC